MRPPRNGWVFFFGGKVELDIFWLFPILVVTAIILLAYFLGVEVGQNKKEN